MKLDKAYSEELGRCITAKEADIRYRKKISRPNFVFNAPMKPAKHR